MQSLCEWSSNGHDGISSELLKLISNDIADSITLIINQSLKSGIFPKHLKIAKVTPIYKKDDKKIITNYRPISVLPVVSKVFETVIHEQLSDYFLSNNLFSAQQYGFRKNSSTELAALELIDRLLAQLKNHKIHIDGRQPKTRISKFAIVQKTKKTDLFCNATLHCA